MRIEQLLIGLIIFSLVTVTGVLTIVDININYGKTTSTTDFSQVYNTSGSLYTISQQQKNSTLGGELSSTDPDSSSISGGFRAIRFVSTSFQLYGDIIQAVANTLGIPGYFVTAAITALVIAVVFAVVYLFITRYAGT